MICTHLSVVGRYLLPNSQAAKSSVACEWFRQRELLVAEPIGFSLGTGTEKSSAVSRGGTTHREELTHQGRTQPGPQSLWSQGLGFSSILQATKGTRPLQKKNQPEGPQSTLKLLVSLKVCGHFGGHRKPRKQE